MKKIYLLFLMTPILFVGCSKDDDVSETIEQIICNDSTVNFDTIYLSPESIGFIPYNGKESIYFKNENGVEVKFEPLYPPKSHSFRKTEFELICEGGDMNNYVFTREQYAVSHKCKDLNLQYYLNVYSKNSSQYPEFVDKFSLLFHEPALDNFIDTLIKLEIITSFREKEDLLTKEFANYGNYEFVSKIKLLNKTFNEVYKVIEPKDNLLTEIYFNKEYGIVGFKDLALKLWVFDRIE
jgi:hypothetical protein